MRSFKTEGVVIKRRNLGEADRILTVFTKHHGKITISAKGVRRITSKRSGHIELLNLVSMSLYKGRTVSTLTEVETINNFSDIKSDLKSCGLAYHICELIDGLCAENQENYQVFSLLCSVLSKLSIADDVPSVVAAFEKDLLTALGFASSSEYANTQGLIEQILERRLRTRRILPLFG